METKSLYGLATELQSLENMMMETEIPEQTQETIAQHQEQLLALIQQKTDAVVGYAHYMEDGLELVEKRIKELENFKKSIKGRIERYEEYVKGCLHILGTNKIEGKLASISLSKPATKVEILDESAITFDYLRVVPEHHEIDKVKIKDALKAGINVEGAKLSDGKQTIKFKTGK